MIICFRVLTTTQQICLLPLIYIYLPLLRQLAATTDDSASAEVAVAIDSADDDDVVFGDKECVSLSGGKSKWWIVFIGQLLGNI